MAKLFKIAFFALLIGSLPVADSYAQRGGGREGGGGFGGRGAGGASGFGGGRTGGGAPGFGGGRTGGGGRGEGVSPGFGGFGGRDRSGGGGFSGAPGGDRSAMMSGMAARFDSNGDGQIEASEFQAIPERFRGMLEQNGVRVDRPISLSDFGAQVSKGFEQARASRNGGRGNPNDPRARDGGRQPEGTNGQPVPPSFFVMPARVKVLKELSADLKAADVDGDGMVALYEWTDAGKPFQDYFKLDRNDDGFVTAEEEQGDTELDIARFKSDRLTIVTATSTVANAASKLSFSDQRLATGQRASQYSKPEEDRKRAAQIFGELDKDRNGRITTEEFEQNAKIKSWFESNKIKLSEMDADKFSKTYGKVIAKYREDQDKAKRSSPDSGGRRQR